MSIIYLCGIGKYVRFKYNSRMILTYHEGACIKATAGDLALVFSPVSKDSKNFKPVNFGADIAFVSLQHPDMDGADEASRGEKEPFVVYGPGEYEHSDITIAGFLTKSTYAGKERFNTVYALTLDGISILYLGALGEAHLPAEVLEMDAPDIVFVPVMGDGVLSPTEAQKLAVKLEAKIVIPILYDKDTLKEFLKEAGEDSVKPVDKITLKPKDIAGKEGEVIVLSA